MERVRGLATRGAREAAASSAISTPSPLAALAQLPAVLQVLQTLQTPTPQATARNEAIYPRWPARGAGDVTVLEAPAVSVAGTICQCSRPRSASSRCTPLLHRAVAVGGELAANWQQTGPAVAHEPGLHAHSRQPCMCLGGQSGRSQRTGRSFSQKKDDSPVGPRSCKSGTWHLAFGILAFGICRGHSHSAPGGGG
jgi:hypothetical protein